MSKPAVNSCTSRWLLAKFPIVVLILISISGHTNQQQDSSLLLKSEPFYIDLYHKFDFQQEFKPRGSILVRPRSEYRVAQASFVEQNELAESDVKALENSSAKENTYYLKAALRKRKADKNDKPLKETQTIFKSCSLQTSNLADFITVNLSPLNEFVSLNSYTTDPECINQVPGELSRKFNTTIFIESGVIGPQPDTATYIKRLEDERQNKMKEGKEDNRSFFAKYWIYIVPAVVILMMMSGPEQGAR